MGYIQSFADTTLGISQLQQPLPTPKPGFNLQNRQILHGKYPGAGTFKEPKAQKWRQMMRANVSSFADGNQ